MPSATRLFKKSVKSLSYLFLFPFALSCVPSGASRRSPPPNPVIARRFVLAIDGVDFRDIQAARARGLFASFRAPSRLISTFPSISDVAWHDIMGVQPPPGYQRIYYSTRQNAVIGEVFDAINPIEYERRMDFAFGTKFHHLGAYLISNQVAKSEVDVDVREFFKRSGRGTVYGYNVGPDALQHTRGDLERYLAHLDAKLSELQRSYRQRTGRDLEIIVLSDHGHNRALNATFLPVVETLSAHGYKLSRALKSPSDIAFSVDGVTTGFGVFACPDSVPHLATLLAAMDGVDIVTTRDAHGRFMVRSATELAEITTRGGVSLTYKYDAQSGDPLRYAAVIARMQAAGALDADGFADAATWLRYTATEQYPAALSRIVAGHTTITLNPAPILVSLNDRVRVGLGAVSVANRMRPLGGTHGALSATNALGVLMTNFVDTHDDLTSTVRLQFGGFDDLRDPATQESSMRLLTPAMLRADRFSAFGAFGAFGALKNVQLPSSIAELSDGEPVAVLSLSDADRRWKGDSARLMIDIRKDDRGADGGSIVSNSYWALSQWTAAPNGRAFALPAAQLGLSLLAPAPLRASQAYVVRVVMYRQAAAGVPTRGEDSRVVATLIARTDARGALALY